MPDITQIQVSTTTYDIKDKILRDATNCPISTTLEDLPSSWKSIGTGFFSIQNPNILINQPNQYGFIYNLVDDSTSINNANIVQLFFDYNYNKLYTRTGTQNIDENIDNWAASWAYYTNDQDSLNRVIKGLDINNHIYTNQVKQIIRIADDANTPIVKLQESNDSTTGLLTAELVLQRKNNNDENRYNILGLSLDENGYATYRISNPKSFKEALGLSTYISNETLYFII